MIDDFCKQLIGEDVKLFSEVMDCVLNPSAYFENHLEDFLERGFEEEDIEEVDDIRLLGMVDILIANEFACELDWKTDLDEFMHWVEEMPVIKRNGLTLDKDDFDEDDCIAIWCQIVDDKWKKNDICIAAIDIESDSYVIFPYAASKMNNLIATANGCGIRVDYAKNM